jgi:hypothetical protein
MAAVNCSIPYAHQQLSPFSLVSLRTSPAVPVPAPGGEGAILHYGNTGVTICYCPAGSFVKRL